MDNSIGEMKVFDEFELYGTIYASNKYKKGVDIEYVNGRKGKNTHGIYTLSIWVYEVPTYDEDVLGISVRYSPVDDLERKILTEYKDRYDTLPILNVIRR